MRIATILTCLLVLAAPVGADEAPRDERPIVAAFFSSAFCGACHVLGPRFETLQARFAGRSVEFVKLNQTASLVTGGRLARVAEEKGIAQAWEANRGATGVILLVDPADGRVLDALTVRETEDEMRARIAAALSPDPIG